MLAVKSGGIEPYQTEAHTGLGFAALPGASFLSCTAFRRARALTPHSHLSLELGHVTRPRLVISRWIPLMMGGLPSENAGRCLFPEP